MKQKKRILKVAQEIDYTANIPARILAGGKSNIIGLVVADNSNPYYARVNPRDGRYCQTKWLRRDPVQH